MRTKLMLFGTVLIVALLAAMPGASADGTQTWNGLTKQGLPMDFTVTTSEGSMVIQAVDVEFSQVCRRDGTLLISAASYSGLDIPVVDGSFTFTDQSTFGYFTWRGKIEGTDSHGKAKLLLPGLTANLDGQVCTSGAPTWSAAPTGAASGTHVPKPSMRLRVVRHRDGTISRTVSSASH